MLYNDAVIRQRALHISKGVNEALKLSLVIEIKDCKKQNAYYVSGKMSNKLILLQLAKAPVTIEDAEYLLQIL